MKHRWVSFSSSTLKIHTVKYIRTSSSPTVAAAERLRTLSSFHWNTIVVFLRLLQGKSIFHAFSPFLFSSAHSALSSDHIKV